jgi:RNA polymerase sigma-70 factor, ECF subfamily
MPDPAESTDMGVKSETSDATLIEQLLGHDRACADAAMTALYRRHANAVYRFASMIASTSEIAGDAMQEAFIWLAGEGASKWNAERGSVAALLCGVARNHVLRLQTADARFVLPEDDDALAAIIDSRVGYDDLPDGYAELDAREREAAMHEALSQLPHEFREVIVLVEFEEFSYEEASATIGCPIGTVRSRLNRAKARLKESLAELFAPQTGNTP